MIRKYYVYIMASGCNRVLYIGMTNDLHRRVFEHKTHRNKGFTKEYNVTKLVYYELYYYVNNAITRERQLKKWNRAWKENLVNNVNPLWLDLNNDLRPCHPPTVEQFDP
ncbi:MAG: GIY-YIG nuclease family protein [Bacteroidales bacterium]